MDVILEASKALLSAFVLFSPAVFANIFAEMSRHIPKTEWLAKPVDGGRLFLGYPLFGKNKTWRGFIFGVLAATIAGVFIQIFQGPIERIFFSDLNMITDGQFIEFNFLPFSILLGIGALLGDMFESFFKRRLHIPSGEPWFFYDQVDFIIGAVLITLPLYQFAWYFYIFAIFMYFLTHLAGKYVGYLWGWSKMPI